MPAEKPHIFLVDDDTELRALTADYLEQQGIAVTGIPSGDELLRRLPRLRPDLIVLDVMMPGTGGLAVCRELRAKKDMIPIIMLTGRKDDIDRIVGIEMGADDYLGKPFVPRELAARILAVIRRSGGATAAPRADAQPVCFGECTFSLTGRTLQRGSLTTPLTDQEFALLAALTDRPRQPVSREHLLELCGNRGELVFDRAIDVAIHRLRKLVERDASAPRYIQTMRGRGYVFVPD
jgi:two-component system, OmpR family, phosphate regulon response regulator OmpR